MPGCDGTRAVERNYPTSEVRDGGREEPRPRSPLHGRRRAERSYSMFKVRRGDIAQGKEQPLHFAGAAVKRYPKSKVRETQVRR